jgi:hypothetical protein
MNTLTKPKNLLFDKPLEFGNREQINLLRWAEKEYERLTSFKEGDEVPDVEVVKTRFDIIDYEFCCPFCDSEYESRTLDMVITVIECKCGTVFKLSSEKGGYAQIHNLPSKEEILTIIRIKLEKTGGML